MIWLLAPFIGLWRMWRGRGTDGWPDFLKRTDGRQFPGATYVQDLVLICIVAAFVRPWNIALTDAVALLLLARIAGHTPMLYGPGLLPLTASLKGIEGFLYGIAKAVADGEIRWWIFAILRYVVPAVAWRQALLLQHDDHGHYVGMAALAMIAVYRLKAALNVETKWAELVGWMAYGVALAI